MANAAVLRSLTRSAPRLQSRAFNSTRLALDAAPVVPPAPAPVLGTVPPPKRPVGGFRGGIVGFLAGFSLAASLAAYNLLDEYKLASAALQDSVHELQQSTEKITAHVRRIEAVEKDLKALATASATTEDVSRVRAEMKKLYDGLHVEFLDLRAHVWGIQQDIHSLSKKDTRVKVV